MSFNKIMASLLFVWIVGITVIMSWPLMTTHAQSAGYVKSGQQAVTATATVVTGISYGTVCIKALNANTINVYLGGTGITTSTGMELAPGNAYCAPQVNTNPFYVIASTTGASVSWIVSR